MATTVTISTSIMRHEVYRDDAAMRLLIHLLLVIAADEEDAPSDRVAGTTTRSLMDIAAPLKWSRSRVYRVARKLEAMDAVHVTKTSSGTIIKCLYYVPNEEQKKPLKKKTAVVREDPMEQRVERFTAACKAVCDADPTRLPEAMRKEFHAYWTEPNAKGQMRFEAQPFFDHARRMDTWRRNAEAKEERRAAIKEEASAPPPKWNPRA